MHCLTATEARRKRFEQLSAGFRHDLNGEIDSNDANLDQDLAWIGRACWHG